MDSIASDTDTDIFLTTNSQSSLPEDNLSKNVGASNSFSAGPGVGLSNPQLSQGRRRMLDLVNRLHSTG